MNCNHQIETWKKLNHLHCYCDLMNCNHQIETCQIYQFTITTKTWSITSFSPTLQFWDNIYRHLFALVTPKIYCRIPSVADIGTDTTNNIWLSAYEQSIHLFNIGKTYGNPCHAEFFSSHKNIFAFWASVGLIVPTRTSASGNIHKLYYARLGHYCTCGS